MFTPQQIQEQTFSKAVFGGYDMQQVDEFLEPLTEDYITLYKENSVLKSKMKILVEKLEEYRAQEAENKQMLAKAQAQCDQMIAEAQKKCTAMMEGAETTARVQTGDIQKQVDEEQERLNYAKQTALNFIDVIEQDIRGHLELLETLKNRDLSLEKKEEAASRAKPYDWQADVSAPSAAQETARDIASEISENLEKLMGETPVEEPVPAAKSIHPESKTILFDDLKFGKNYDPTNR